MSKFVKIKFFSSTETNKNKMLVKASGMVPPLPQTSEKYTLKKPVD